jgi:hypothetical protein
MKKLAVLLLMIASPAFAHDMPADAIPGPTTPVAAAPAQPAPTTSWKIEDLDQSDLATLNACAMELPKRIADPFIQRLTGKIKPTVK